MNLFENLQLLREANTVNESYNRSIEISDLDKNDDILCHLMDMLDLKVTYSKLSTKSNQLFVFTNLKRLVGISTIDEAIELLAAAIEEFNHDETGNSINKIKKALQNIKFASGVLKVLNMNGYSDYYMNIDSPLAFSFKYDIDGTILFSNDDGDTWLDIDDLVYEARLNAEEDSDYDEFSYDTDDLANDMFKEYEKFKKSIA